MIYAAENITSQVIFNQIIGLVATLCPSVELNPKSGSGLSTTEFTLNLRETFLIVNYFGFLVELIALVIHYVWIAQNLLT